MVHLDWILNLLERHPFFAYFAQDFWPFDFFWIFPSSQVMKKYSWACLHLKERKDPGRPCFKLFFFYNFNSINDRRFVGRSCVLCNLVVNYFELKTILMPSNGFWKGTIRQNTGSVKVNRHFSRIIAFYQHAYGRLDVSGHWSSPDRVNIYALFCSLYILLCIVV